MQAKLKSQKSFRFSYQPSFVSKQTTHTRNIKLININAGGYYYTARLGVAVLIVELNK